MNLFYFIRYDYKYIAKALTFVLATGIIATPINNIGNVAVVSADESSETVKKVRGNLDSLVVKNIKTGDKIVAKFTVGGTNYDVAGEVIMPNAKPTETPTAEPTKEPKDFNL